jgi:DNA ligase 1
MPDLDDGETTEIQGSGSKPYIIKNVGGVYSCTCPAWRNQSLAIERRTCKHIRKFRGEAAEEERIGGALPAKPVKASATGEDGESVDPPLLLAESWDTERDIAGWWMSEKLDGVRAYWDGKQFLSRQGNIFHAPDWFIEGLPLMPLDGELWIDRKAFQRTVGIVKRQDKPTIWKEVKYLIFDAPDARGGFEDRLKFLKDIAKKWAATYATIHDHKECRDADHLMKELKKVEALGGEGLMLREPGSQYVPRRSSTLLKVKTFHDAEAVVIGYQAGKGKHSGRMGAVVAKLPNGKEFEIGTGFTDKQRANPPAIGSNVTFRYQELTEAGIPRFPSFVRERADVAPTATAVSVPKPKAEPAPKPVMKAVTSSGGARRFEFEEDGSSKFWEVSVSGSAMTTKWGRIGTEGQSKTKTFATPEKAQTEADKLIAEKTKKGYTETT